MRKDWLWTDLLTFLMSIQKGLSLIFSSIQWLWWNSLILIGDISILSLLFQHIDFRFMRFSICWKNLWLLESKEIKAILFTHLNFSASFSGKSTIKSQPHQTHYCQLQISVLCSATLNLIKLHLKTYKKPSNTVFQRVNSKTMGI